MERRLVQKVFEEAVNRGSAEVIQLLLKNDVEFDINARFAKESLLTAAERGRETMIPLLLDVGANIQGKDDRGGGGTALHLAAMNGHYKIVEQLLDRGADPTVKNRFGRAAEYWAS